MRYFLSFFMFYFLLPLQSVAGESSTDDLRFALWDREKRVPVAAELPGVEGVEFVQVKPHEPEVDGYDWLHGAALCWHKGELYASFGLNQGDENTSTEIASGCMSSDGGQTWGPLFAIDNGDTANPAVSHGVLLSFEDRLWAFQGAFTDRMRRVHTLAYVRNDQTGRWAPKGVVAEDGFWPIGDRHILLHFSHMSGGKYLLGDYDTQRQKFAVTAAGDINFGPYGPCGVHAPSAAPDGKGAVIAIFNMKRIKLRVFIDHSVVEVFVNNRQCVAVRVYPEREESLGISFRAQGKEAMLKSLDAWRMENIHEAGDGNR